MSSATITTIVTMLESLPDAVQEQVAEHIHEFIADLEDGARWEAVFKQTHTSLVATAQQARREIAEGQSTPMDYEQL